MIYNSLCYSVIILRNKNILHISFYLNDLLTYDLVSRHCINRNDAKNLFSLYLFFFLFLDCTNPKNVLRYLHERFLGNTDAYEFVLKTA